MRELYATGPHEQEEPTSTAPNRSCHRRHEDERSRVPRRACRLRGERGEMQGFSAGTGVVRPLIIFQSSLESLRGEWVVVGTDPSPAQLKHLGPHRRNHCQHQPRMGCNQQRWTGAQVQQLIIPAIGPLAIATGLPYPLLWPYSSSVCDPHPWDPSMSRNDRTRTRTHIRPRT